MWDCFPEGSGQAVPRNDDADRSRSIEGGEAEG